MTDNFNPPGNPRQATLDRVRRSLDGLAFPADRFHLIRYVEEHNTDQLSMSNLSDIPDATYNSVDEVLHAVDASIR